MGGHSGLYISGGSRLPTGSDFAIPCCAGGGDSAIELPVQLEAVPEVHAHPQQLRITGLMGGHSGLNISEDRGNAVLLAAHILQAVIKARLVSLTAGDKRNAIAREASAVLLVGGPLRFSC